MVFVYQNWDEFCRKLMEAGKISIPACEVTPDIESFVVLKHDIESAVSRAYKLAKIEYKYGHRGSYYVQAYLLDDSKNIELLKQIQAMGHEISYHYDVMDSNHGNLEKAIEEFEFNHQRFESLGFPLRTVCQHGNPVVERVGYTSNRDFFRNKAVQERYSYMADIMVNYKERYHTDYIYYSDAGRGINLIFDPINNDVVNSDDKNIPFEDLNSLLSELSRKAIISTHPHRWTDSVAAYVMKERTFKVIKATAKMAIRIPGVKKIMSRYYYLAKMI